MISVALLDAIPRAQHSPFVFPSHNGSGNLIGLQKVWERMRARAGLQEVRLHDVRRTYASIGAASGESLYIVGKLVGRKQPSTTQRYAHLADDLLHAAADSIALIISEGLAVGQNWKRVKGSQ